MSLPSTLAYGPKKDAVNATLFNQISVPLNGSTANPLDVLTIPIQGCGKYGMYLDPSMTFLSFQIFNPSATSIVVDNSAYSFIERISVVCSGSVISDLLNFQAYAALMLDQAPQSARSTGMSVALGCDGTAAQTPNNNRKGATIANGGSLNVILPLIGTAIDQSSCDKLIPVGAMSDLQLLIYVSSAPNAVLAASTPATPWQLRNFRLNQTLVQIDEGAQRLVDEATRGVYKWSSSLWRAFNSTTGATDNGNSVIVPIKASSVKGTMTIWRPTAANESYTANWASARHNPFGALSATTFGSFYAQVGAQAVPQIPLRNAAEFFASLENSFHSLNVPGAYDSSLVAGDFDAAAGTSSQAPLGSFVAALNMEAFSGKSHVSHSGVNITGGTTLILNAVYPTALSATHQITTFVNYDAIMEVSGGQAVCSW